MCQSNRLAAPQCLREHGATACTDLTGFGLLGHLVEMTRPSGVDAELDLAALPVLEGAEETSAAGVAEFAAAGQRAAAPCASATRRAASSIRATRCCSIRRPPAACSRACPATRAAACVEALRALGYLHTAIIGRVLPQGEALEPIVLKR